jgi:WD40 repeat protein
VLHKGKIQGLAFSPNETYLATLGGRDDNKLVIWDLQTGDSICGATAASDSANTVRFFNNTEDMLVTGGNYNLRVWSFDRANRKLRPTDCHMGQVKRVITQIEIDDDDVYMYAGTKTGDLLQVSLGPKLLVASGPAKRPLSLGINAVLKTRSGDYVVGAGDGTIALMKADGLKIVRRLKVLGGVTSLALNAAGDQFFVGTDACNQYLVHLGTFEYELRLTCHSDRINGVCFPGGYSELFATCADNDIRVWHLRTRAELLRIQVPNLECLCVTFAADGKSIISGWSDGKIRAFRPQSGKLIYAINDAHRDGVTAIAGTNDGRSVVSGGADGQVRVWAIGRQTQKMVASMKEHKAMVNSVRVSADDTECVSASADGSCIVWSLTRFVRNNCLFASTQFQAVVYHPDQSQLLTTGTDRKLTYWDAVDGNPIRMISGSQEAQVNALAVDSSGARFVSGGDDKLLRVWGYDEGYCAAVGVGHSGGITDIAIAPDQETIISVGDEAAIFLWGMPQLDGGDGGGDDYDDDGGVGDGVNALQLGGGGGGGGDYEEVEYAADDGGEYADE